MDRYDANSVGCYVMDIKVISTTPDRMLNFHDVTDITKSDGWIFIKRESEVLAILIEQNIVAILQKGD